MADILVDSNVILDVVTEDVRWFGWSSRQLEELAERHILVINPVIYSEVSVSPPIPFNASLFHGMQRSWRASASCDIVDGAEPSGLRFPTSSSEPMPQSAA